MPKNTTLFDIPLYNGTYSDFLGMIQNPEKKTLVFTPNPEIFVRASRDSEFMDILKQATYNVPDGNGLYVGYMMQQGRGFFVSGLRTFFDKKGVRKEYGELVKGSDLTRDILESQTPLRRGDTGGFEEPEPSVTLWQPPSKGGYRKILVIDRKNEILKNELEVNKAEVQKNLKSIIEAKYPGVEVFVVFAGEKNPKELAELIVQENISFVFSCVGMKTQEKLLVEIFDHLPNTQKVVGLGVGASIDFLLGLQKRAPIVFQKLGLEWLYRLITQPKIRARRIWDAVVEFPKLVQKTSR